MTNSLQAVLNAKKAEKPNRNDKNFTQKDHPGRASKVMIGGHFSRVMWQQLSGQFFKRHSEFAQTEPPRVYRRPVCLSYAALGVLSSAA